MLTGTIENTSSLGMFVNIPALKTTYGPLPYLDHPGGYTVGDRVAVSKVGPDEYIVVGVIRP